MKISDLRVGDTFKIEGVYLMKIEPEELDGSIRNVQVICNGGPLLPKGMKINLPDNSTIEEWL